MTFTQLTARFKNFLRGWLLILGLKECLEKCATLCLKSECMHVHVQCSALGTGAGAGGDFSHPQILADRVLYKLLIRRQIVPNTLRLAPWIFRTSYNPT